MIKELNKLSIRESLEGLKSRSFTSKQLVQAYLDQIHIFDSEINSIITLNEDNALKSAEKADKMIEENNPQIFEKYPLLGIPYLCKDNFSTKGIKTTAASNVLKDYIPPFESTVTQKLSDAGAVLLGKTNMDSFAHGSSSETSDIFPLNSKTGPTKNPWDYTKVPGGSSGGSAAALAANFAIFTIGSETAGSIRGPASWCGVTGLKPTYGRVSRYGVVAMGSSLDSPGPITKTVWDAGYVLSIISGKDKFDATSSDLETEDYIQDLEIDLSKIRIGIPKSYFGEQIEAGVLAEVSKVIEFYKSKGAEIVEIYLLDPENSISVYTILHRSEVSSNLARFDGIRYGNDRSHFNFENKKRMMLGAYALSSGYYDAYYSKAQKVRTLIINDFKKAYENVDIILGPTFPTTALKIGESEKYSIFGELMDALQEPSAIAGLTAISIPCGFAEEMPVGVQLIAPHFKEKFLLQIANAFQNETDFHLQFPELKNMKGAE